jgi:hypothetical protein
MRYALSAACAWQLITFHCRFERLPRRANARRMTEFAKQISKSREKKLNRFGGSAFTR